MQPPRRYRPIDIILIVAGSGIALLGGLARRRRDGPLTPAKGQRLPP
jgi:hypothetical protein